MIWERVRILALIPGFSYFSLRAPTIRQACKSTWQRSEGGVLVRGKTTHRQKRLPRPLVWTGLSGSINLRVINHIDGPEYTTTFMAANMPPERKEQNTAQRFVQPKLRIYVLQGLSEMKLGESVGLTFELCFQKHLFVVLSCGRAWGRQWQRQQACRAIGRC